MVKHFYILMLGVKFSFLLMLAICITTDSRKKITGDFRKISCVFNENSSMKLFLGCFLFQIYSTH